MKINRSLVLIIGVKTAIIREAICARSEAGLSRLPVTEEIAGSNPVGRAKISTPPCVGYLFSDMHYVWLGVVPRLDKLPVHHLPPICDILISFIFIIEVVCMLPYIESHERLTPALHHRGVLIGHRKNLKVAR